MSRSRSRTGPRPLEYVLLRNTSRTHSTFPTATLLLYVDMVEARDHPLYRYCTLLCTVEPVRYSTTGSSTVCTGVLVPPVRLKPYFIRARVLTHSAAGCVLYRIANTRQLYRYCTLLCTVAAGQRQQKKKIIVVVVSVH
jgi:hypothetical protein